MEIENIKIADLFCGTGGFSKGFENSKLANYEVKLGIDLLKDAVETFKLNHSNAVGINCDINKLKKSDIISNFGIKRGDLDLVIGGPPCQGFSSIRPYRSGIFEDPRNHLFVSYASFVDFFRPKVIVLENVVGLVTHKNGETLEIMQDTFNQIGYETEWRILNTANYGIPQKRERFIMIGVERGAKIIFPRPTHTFDGNTIGYRNKDKMIRVKKDLFANVLPDALTILDAISDLPILNSGESSSNYTCEPNTEYQIKRRKKNGILKLHSSTKHSEEMLEIIKHSGPNISFIPKELISSGFSTSYSRLANDEPSVTITVNFVHPASNRCIHPNQNRALTPREGARIQSFDDDFEFYGSRTQIVKQIGNAVPPLLGQAIGDALSVIF